MNPYPLATVVIPTDAATVYGWNDDEAMHLVILGELTEGLRNTVLEAVDQLEQDRAGHNWARAMLKKLPAVAQEIAKQRGQR